MSQPIGGNKMAQRLWVSDNGDAVCEEHAGMYLRSSIQRKPKAIKHRTPLGNWSLYFTHLIGGGNLVCETCIPWNSPEHPYNKTSAGA
jgi:hypothetical protein